METSWSDEGRAVIGMFLSRVKVATLPPATCQQRIISSKTNIYKRDITLVRGSDAFSYNATLSKVAECYSLPRRAQIRR